MFPRLEKQASKDSVKCCSPMLSYCCQAPKRGSTVSFQALVSTYPSKFRNRASCSQESRNQALRPQRWELGKGVCVCVLESHDQDPLCQLKLSTEPSDCHLWSLGIFLDAACHGAQGVPKGSLSFKSNESTLEAIIPEPFLIFP